MKRRLLYTVLFILWLFATPCVAQTTRVEDGQGMLVFLDFDGELPMEAQVAFASVLRDGDRVLCGVVQNRRIQQEGVLAVEREGKLLLLGVCCPNGENVWRAAVETDSFFMPGTVIDMTAEPVYDGFGEQYDKRVVITCGEEQYGIRLFESGAMWIDTFERQEADGGLFCVTMNPGWISCERYTEDLREMLYNAQGVIPARVAAWTHETFPKDAQEAQRIVETYALQLEGDEVFLSGGNLRERPTGSSASWGKYAAKAKKLDSKMGEKEPWIQVQVGDLVGWMSDNYVLTSNDVPARYYGVPSSMCKVAKVTRETVLYTMPGESAVATFPEGVYLHVLMEKDGWLHVIFPQGDMTWQTDWDGTYGFIPAEDAVVGVSIADAKWK